MTGEGQEENLDGGDEVDSFDSDGISWRQARDLAPQPLIPPAGSERTTEYLRRVDRYCDKSLT